MKDHRLLVRGSINLPLSKTILILIDVWDDSVYDALEKQGRGWPKHTYTILKKRSTLNLREKLFPLVKALKKRGIFILHFPHRRKAHRLLREMKIKAIHDENARDMLLEVLQEQQITHLLSAGYCSNKCVLKRPTVGISTMAEYDYQIVFVRDASIALEIPWDGVNELLHEAAISNIETYFGATTTVTDVLNMLESASIEGAGGYAR